MAAVWFDESRYNNDSDDDDNHDGDDDDGEPDERDEDGRCRWVARSVFVCAISDRRRPELSMFGCHVQIDQVPRRVRRRGGLFEVREREKRKRSDI